MGNPNAPVKLVEYASISCPHCAEFTEEGGADRCATNMSSSGQVSWEYRPYMIFPTDPGDLRAAALPGAGALLPASPSSFMPTSAIGTAACQALPPAQLQQIDELPAAAAQCDDRCVLAGLDEFFRQRGMPQAQDRILPRRPANLQQASPRSPHRGTKRTMSPARRPSSSTARSAEARPTGRASSRLLRSAMRMKRARALRRARGRRGAGAGRAGASRRRPARRPPRRRSATGPGSSCAHARGRLPHGQSGGAGEARRIWLAHLPASARAFDREGAPALRDRYVQSGPGQLGISHLSDLSRPIRASSVLAPLPRTAEPSFRSPSSSTPTQERWYGPLRRGAARAAPADAAVCR